MDRRKARRGMHRMRSRTLWRRGYVLVIHPSTKVDVCILAVYDGKCAFAYFGRRLENGEGSLVMARKMIEKSMRLLSGAEDAGLILVRRSSSHAGLFCMNPITVLHWYTYTLLNTHTQVLYGIVLTRPWLLRR
jgi:hypothetical protein